MARSVNDFSPTDLSFALVLKCGQHLTLEEISRVLDIIDQEAEAYPHVFLALRKY